MSKKVSAFIKLKGLDLFLNDISPYAIKKSKGCFAYDVDGNKYIDNIMSLGAVIIGHANKEINQEVRKQLNKGTLYSLASELEGQLAEMLCDRIPSADVVRFGKNGNDATTAAIRLSRHYTNKDHILFCGYHAWQDWYICKTSMDKGIPKEVAKYSHRFIYNDIESLLKLFDRYKNKIACVIMEPTSKEEPYCKKLCSLCKSEGKKSCKGFLNQVQKTTRKNNALLIFDEIVTADPISANHRALIPYVEFGVTFEYLGFEWYLKDRFSMPTIKSDDSLYGVLSAGISLKL